MKPTVIDPKTTTRAAAFDLWMSAPNPMMTFFKTLDVTPLVKFSRKRGLKFNMLLCWCIGKTASEIKEFYTLPVGRELLQYDSIAVNTIVKNKTGEASSCDVPFSSSLVQFNAEGISQLTGALDADQLHALQAVVEEMTSRLAGYTSFAGAPEGTSSRVKFLYKTAETPAETAPVETAADNASEGNFFLRLWHRLLALFGL